MKKAYTWLSRILIIGLCVLTTFLLYKIKNLQELYMQISSQFDEQNDSYSIFKEDSLNKLNDLEDENQRLNLEIDEANKNKDVEKEKLVTKIVELENENLNLKSRLENKDPSQIDSRIIEIIEELASETIEIQNQDSKYEMVISRPDKSFCYDNIDTVFIINSGVFEYKIDDPLDINRYYQDIVNKFAKLVDSLKPITQKEIIEVGFKTEVYAYNFKSIYPDFIADYEALIKNYLYQRRTLEFEISRFSDNISTIEKIEECYKNYLKSKNMLNEYIMSYTPGDL